MKTVFAACVVALALTACATGEPPVTSPDPALGASATALHQEMAALPAEGTSSADRHAPGNYYPLD